RADAVHAVSLERCRLRSGRGLPGPEPRRASVREPVLRLCAGDGLRAVRRRPAAAPDRPGPRASSGLADRAQGGRRQRRPVRRPRKGLRPRTGRAAFLRLARGRSAPPATTRPPRRPERRHGGQGGLEPSGRLGASIEHRRSLGHLLKTRRGREAMNKKTRFHLTRGAALGAAIALGSLASSPALAEWRRAETEHFIVYGDASEGSLRRYAQ